MKKKKKFDEVKCFLIFSFNAGKINLNKLILNSNFGSFAEELNYYNIHFFMNSSSSTINFSQINRHSKFSDEAIIAKEKEFHTISFNSFENFQNNKNEINTLKSKGKKEKNKKKDIPQDQQKISSFFKKIDNSQDQPKINPILKYYKSKIPLKNSGK